MHDYEHLTEDQESKASAAASKPIYTETQKKAFEETQKADAIRFEKENNSPEALANEILAEQELQRQKTAKKQQEKTLKKATEEAQMTLDTAKVKQEEELESELDDYYEKVKKAYIKKTNAPKGVLDIRFQEFMMMCNDKDYKVGTKAFINELTTWFPGIKWEKAPLADPIKKEGEKEESKSRNKVIAWPTSSVSSYNYIYSEVINGKAAGKKVDLRKKNEKGELNPKAVRIVGNEQYPWILCETTIKDTKVKGFIHANILTVLLDEVVVDSRLKISNERTVVKAKSGANFYKKPHGDLIKKLEFNDELIILSVDEQQWAHVNFQGKEGYVNVNFLNTKTPMPCTGAKLYKIKAGEGIDDIVKKKIGSGKEMDRRFYANVLIHVNNPGNDAKRGIYIEDTKFDLTEFITIDYDRFKTREDYLIWIPPKAYCEGLKGVVNSGSYKNEVKESIQKRLGKPLSEALDEYWPENWGAFFSADVAATFAIPFGVKSRIETYFYRKDKKTLALKKYDKFAFGFDTGASAGFFIGKRGSKKGGTGFGAKAGVNAEAMAATYGLAEYEFPIQDNDAVISALSAILVSKKWKSTVDAVSLFFDVMTGTQLHPFHYLTKSALAVGIEAQASAHASAGVMKNGADKQVTKYKEKGSYSSDEAPDAITTTPLQALNPFNKKAKLQDLLLKNLSIGADALVSINPKIGVEHSRKLAHKNGEVHPESETLDVFIEVGGQANIKAALPLLGKLGPAFNSGMGVKATFTAKEGEEWSDPILTMYVMSGEMDFYDTGAMKTEVMMGSSMKEITEKFSNIDVEKLASIFKGTKVQKRLHLANFMSKKVNKLLTNKQDFKSKVKLDNKKKGYYDIDAYLDIEIDFSKLSNQELEEAASTVLEFFKSDSKVDKVMQGISLFMSWTNGMVKGDSGTVSKFVDALNRSIREGIFANALLHVRAGIGLAGGFSAAFGGKIKLAGGISGGVLYEQEVRDQIAKYVTEKNIQTFFKSVRNLSLPDKLGGMLEEAVKFNGRNVKL